jgi:hypothetical protein
LTSSQLSYDPETKTLFVPKHVSEALSITDGSVLPLPHDVLREAIADGQIQLVGKPPEDNSLGLNPPPKQSKKSRAEIFVRSLLT